MKPTVIAFSAALLAMVSSGAWAQTAAPAPMSPPAMASPQAAAPAPQVMPKAMPAKAVHHKAMMSPRRIEELQVALRNTDQTLAIDGLWGPKTRAALADFQKKNGLRVTGRFDHRTARKLTLPHWHA